MTTKAPKRLTIPESTRLRQRAIGFISKAPNKVSELRKLLGCSRSTAGRIYKNRKEPLRRGLRRCYALHAARKLNLKVSAFCKERDKRPPIGRTLPTWKGAASPELAHKAAQALSSCIYSMAIQLNLRPTLSVSYDITGRPDSLRAAFCAGLAVYEVKIHDPASSGQLYAECKGRGGQPSACLKLTPDNLQNLLRRMWEQGGKTTTAGFEKILNRTINEHTRKMDTGKRHKRVHAQTKGERKHRVGGRSGASGARGPTPTSPAHR